MNASTVNVSRVLGSLMLLTAALPSGPAFAESDQKAQAADKGRAEADARRNPRLTPFERLILESAEAHDVPAPLVKAVVKVESDFDSEALSRVGAQGLMQLMPATAKELGVDEPLDPKQNIDGGTRYWRDLKRRFGTWTLALAAYNSGPSWTGPGLVDT